MDLRENSKAITAMLLAMAAFLTNDAIVKFVHDELPLGQIIVMRSVFASILIYAASVAMGVHREFRHLAHPTVGWRTLGELGSTYFYLAALIHLPIANITSVLQSLPLLVTAAAAIFLGATVGWRRWTAIGIGFAGVLIIIRPGVSGFNEWSLVALCGVFCMVLRDLSTRRMPQAIPTFGVTLVTCFGVMALGGVMVIFEGWEPMTARQIGIIAAGSLFLLAGYIFIIIAMRLGDIAIVSPFRYSSILWAILIGYVVWSEVPDALTLLGTAIVVSTGVYTFIRERKLARQGQD